ncbi:unnamed protein product [Trichogramma brassicae]|uniref:Uncharacterized protein n=1 Tax=Trichogramma brassicae TaxID=86971 RepID=A0A6H5HZU6_9HYME|nr:unnamed protein product [Trichogramma brassicae]
MRITSYESSPNFTANKKHSKAPDTGRFHGLGDDFNIRLNCRVTSANLTSSPPSRGTGQCEDRSWEIVIVFSNCSSRPRSFATASEVDREHQGRAYHFKGKVLRNQKGKAKNISGQDLRKGPGGLIVTDRAGWTLTHATNRSRLKY